jgi:hypothetical protein
MTTQKLYQGGFENDSKGHAILHKSQKMPKKHFLEHEAPLFQMVYH